MKQILKTLIVSLLLIPVFSLASEQNVEEVPLHIEVPSNGGPHAPAVIQVSCYVSSSMNTLFVNSNVISCYANIVIINETTADTLSDTIQIGTIPAVESLFGPGDYSVSITLFSGVTYYGAFSL